MAANIHIENLIVTPDAFSSVSEQLLSGASPEVLRDIGYQVPEGAEQLEAEQPVSPAEEEQRLQDLAAETTPIPANIDTATRSAHLYKAITIAGPLRRIRGGITTSQPTTIRDKQSAKEAHAGYVKRFGDNLAQACGACAFQGACRLEGKPEAWLRRHPDKSKVTNKQQESIQKFTDRLDSNPMAHCVPPTPKKQA